MLKHKFNHNINTKIKLLIKNLTLSNFTLDNDVLPYLQNIKEEKFDVNEIIKKITDNYKQKNKKIIKKIDLEKILQLLDKKSSLKKDVDIKNLNNKFQIIQDPTKLIKPVPGSKGFSTLFSDRYKKFFNIILKSKLNINPIKIRDIDNILKNKKLNTKNYTFHVSGLILEKESYKNSIKITLDDDTGNYAFNLYEDLMIKFNKNCLLDQMVILKIKLQDNNLIVIDLEPIDIPLRTSNYAKNEIYTILLSDIHVGSKYFLEKNFKLFLEWVSGNLGDLEIINKIGYIIIAGDIVDGVGIYPDQKEELKIIKIEEQYNYLAELLKKIPSRIKIFIIPGDHDATRSALPQPAIPKQYAKSLYELTNVTMLGNPSLINLNDVNFLIFHGRSLTDIMTKIPGLKFNEPTSHMKILLKNRHLTPIYGLRTPISPELQDYLLINDIPDVFHSGHLHTFGAERYRGTWLINSGCWQSKTVFQENVGIEPKSCIIPYINLKDLKVSFKNFIIDSA